MQTADSNLNRKGACACAFLVGFVALSYEVVWVRFFSFISAGSAKVVGSVLGFYLIGLAIGALYGCRPDAASSPFSRNRNEMPWFTFLSSSFGAYLLIPIVSRFSTVIPWWLSLPTLIIPTVGFGVMLPYLCSVESDRSVVGISVSRIYFSNIMGSAFGSLLTGYALCEFMTVSQITTFVTILAAMLTVTCIKLSIVVTNALGMAMACVLFLLGPSLYESTYERAQFKNKFSSSSKFMYTIENRSGVITVTADGKVYGNGAYDGVISIDPVKYPGLIRPYFLSAVCTKPKRVLIIGVSAGSWTQIIVNNPDVQSVTAIEINDGYLNLIRELPEMRSLLNNPKLSIIVDDGRRWLRRNSGRFDCIIMNTTMHWRELVSARLSSEFVDLAKQHLNPGGIFMWNTTDSQRSVATGLNAFRYGIMVFNAFVGCDQPIAVDVQRWKRVLSEYRINGTNIFNTSDCSRTLALSNILSVVDGLHPAGRVMIQKELAEFANGAKLITDDNLGHEFEF